MQLKLEHISFRYGKKSAWILKDVNFCVRSGERVGLIAPSGCGKSTLAEIAAGYLKPSAGCVTVDQKPLPEKGMCPVQMICQHPEYAVNPRWKMRKVLNECWTPGEELLESMGIEKKWLSRWPSELSGGELQRFCIARVLSPEVKFLVCDEITTMLDVITQAQIWKFLLEYGEAYGYGMIIVTHNTELAEKVCTRIVNLQEINHVPWEREE